MLITVEVFIIQAGICTNVSKDRECVSYWTTVNFSRKAMLCQFVCYLPHFIPVEVKIFVTLTPWRPQKDVSGQLHVSSTSAKRSLYASLSGHIAGETSAFTLPVFEHPIIYPIACYCFDFVKPIPVLFEVHSSSRYRSIVFRDCMT